MEAKRRIRAKEFINYVLSGKSHHQLMEHYCLSSNELNLVIDRLVEAGFLAKDTAGLSCEDIPDRIARERRSRRRHLTTFLPVYDVDDLLAEGQLLDISDTGMRVSGIEASEGEEKKLMIEVNYEADVYSLYVTAICRWTKPEPDGSLVAGFEVTAWPPVADEVLDLITQSLALCDEEDPGVR